MTDLSDILERYVSDGSLPGAVAMVAQAIRLRWQRWARLPSAVIQ